MIKLRVFHAYYGCDTGCCGHVFELDGSERKIGFQFSHPSDFRDEKDKIEFAKRVVKERAPECFDLIDWATVDVSEVTDNGWNC